MKNKLYIFILVFLILGCSSDDDGCVGIDCLPEATQTGADTFGCLVNGEPFVDNSGDFNCFYQLVDGEYYFGIQSEREVLDLVLIGIGSNRSEIIKDTTIHLNDDVPNNFYAGLNIKNLGGTLLTSNSNDGQIIFTNFSINPNIVSAEFEFTVTDPNTGKVYEITEGRFDAQFNQ